MVNDDLAQQINHSDAKQSPLGTNSDLRPRPKTGLLIVKRRPLPSYVSTPRVAVTLVVIGLIYHTLKLINDLVLD